ncbi:MULTISPECIES: transcription antitermination factor NusB [unclassified Mycoplasma]|uniref:transcription antitermination factor NusB n=1 Tax=unclassified Mycoplasma TaxID=2683645 RepID=UPI00216B2A80|nr:MULTISPECIES: transcription antitermination factor NusB [unclassified Mycoplasma]MCS4536857.1 transcription antitermination protein NusB [Mycoplasma sp. CSL7475-4]MCT4469696.1 transcription antitermination protein NusB [Mycoplasma sp. HS2188]
MNKKTKSRRTNRIEVINVIYACELLNNYDLARIRQTHDELNDEQFLQLEKVVQNKDYLAKIIDKFLTNKTWNEESPLIRAILLNSTLEMFSINPRIVINEAVEVTKDFFGEESNLYKHVNRVVDNVYRFFVVNEAFLRKYLK